MAEVTCSFCGRSKKDVDLMISGIHAHICDKCVTQANQILGEEKKSKTLEKWLSTKIPTYYIMVENNMTVDCPQLLKYPTNTKSF